MLGSSGRAHDNLNILDTGSLTNWPVNTRSRGCSCNARQVQLEIPNLSEEDICGGPTLITAALVLVAINQTQARESRGSLDHWQRIGVSDNLGKVIVDDGSGDQVRSGREVYNRGGGGRRFSASRTETAS